MKVYDNEDTDEQKDLFSELIQDADSSYDEPGKQAKMTLTLNVDKILLFVLTCAIIFAVVFSYGIETGKKIQNGQDGGAVSSIDGEREKNPSILSLFSKEKEPKSLRSGNTTDTKTVVIPVAVTASAEKPIVVKKKEEEALPVKENVALPQHIWTVQIITYVNKTFAKEELRKIEEKGYEGFILPSGKYYQICVGKFAARTKAVKALDKFKKQKDYSDAYIRKIDRSKILS